MRRLFFWTAALSMMFAVSCAAPVEVPETPAEALVRIDPSHYPDMTDGGDTGSLAEAVSMSLEYLGKLPDDRKLTFGRDEFTVGRMKESLSGFRSFLNTGPAPEEIEKYVRANFDIYMSAGMDGFGTAMFTGYFTPELKASRTKGGPYRYAIYRTPDDMITAELGEFLDDYAGKRITGRVAGRKLQPYYTRAQIDYGGALEGSGSELAWCDDPVEVFFLHVQGSGVLAFENGSTVNVNYDSQNGRAYRSIGRLLIEEGKASPDEMSLDWLRAYLEEHPEETRRVLRYNESYVFFKLEDKGPYGCYGVPVVDERSIATDKAFFPAVALCFISTEVPLFDGKGDAPSSWDSYSRFVMNHDTGGAIKKAGRVDIYFGHGELARKRAGYMKRFGALYVMAPKPETPPS